MRSCQHSIDYSLRNNLKLHFTRKSASVFSMSMKNKPASRNRSLAAQDWTLNCHQDSATIKLRLNPSCEFLRIRRKLASMELWAQMTTLTHHLPRVTRTDLCSSIPAMMKRLWSMHRVWLLRVVALTQKGNINRKDLSYKKSPRLNSLTQKKKAKTSSQRKSESVIRESSEIWCDFCSKYEPKCLSCLIKSSNSIIFLSASSSFLSERAPFFHP